MPAGSEPDPTPITDGVFFTVPDPLPRGRHRLPRSEVLARQRDRLLIAETGANRVLGWVDEELDIFADASVGLAQPVGVAALPSGNILVANHGDGMLVELDAKGAFQRTVDTELGDNRLLSVAVRSDGSVFIVDDEGGFGSLYRVMLP